MSNRKIVIGFILVLVGLALLAQTMEFFLFSFNDFVGFLFPAFLIAVGIWLLARRKGQAQAAEVELNIVTEPPHTPPEPPPYRQATEQTGSAPGGFEEPRRASVEPECSSPGKFAYSKLIGDMYVDCTGVDLQNITISNFLGDVEVKLHGGKLRPGLNRMIISGFIGDVRVLVPQGMAVFAQSSNFIGDIEMMGRRSSGFGNSLDAQTPDYESAESKLYIASNHFIGDVRVYIV